MYIELNDIEAPVIFIEGISVENNTSIVDPDDNILITSTESLFQDGMDVSTPEPFTSHGQVSFLVQPLSNGIKGHPFLSMLRDGLIEEQLIVGVMIAGERRRATGEGEVESQVRWEKYPLTPHK